MRKLTIEELTKIKKEAEKELSDKFNSILRDFEKKTGTKVVQATQSHRYFVFQNPKDNYELFGFELHIEYNGQYIELKNYGE